MRRTGLGLLGHEHHAHAPFADLLQELVGANDRAGTFLDARLKDGAAGIRGRFAVAVVSRGRLQKAAGLLVRREQDLQSLPQRGVAGAGFVKKRSPLVRRFLARQVEKRFFVHRQVSRVRWQTVRSLYPPKRKPNRESTILSAAPHLRL